MKEQRRNETREEKEGKGSAKEKVKDRRGRNSTNFIG